MTTRSAWRSTSVLALATMMGLLAACTGEETVYPQSNNRVMSGNRTSYAENDDTIFGPGGLDFFGGDDEVAPGGAGGIGVNSYLWRASLDTISFMPLASADPFGGVIITDWYSPPEATRERFKVNVYILGRDLRADGLRAAVFRQRQDTLGNWIDVQVDNRTEIDLEDAILTRARQLRIAAAQ